MFSRSTKKSDPELDEDGVSTLHRAVIVGDQTELKACLAKTTPAQLEKPSRNEGYHALHWAALKGGVSSATLLIEAKAIVDARANSALGETPLMVAATEGHHGYIMWISHHAIYR